MKKTLIVALAAILFVAIASFAGPYVDFELTLPATADLEVGVQTDGLKAGILFSDLLSVPWILGFESEYISSFNWWSTELTLDITEIDFFTSYPIPTIGGLALGFEGRLHVGSLLSEDNPGVFDIKTGTTLILDPSTMSLYPTVMIGFYWEL